MPKFRCRNRAQISLHEGPPRSPRNYCLCGCADHCVAANTVDGEDLLVERGVIVGQKVTRLWAKCFWRHFVGITRGYKIDGIWTTS